MRAKYLVALVCLCVVITTVAAASPLAPRTETADVAKPGRTPARQPDGIVGPPIEPPRGGMINKVVALVDQPIEMGDDQPVWESAPFDTSQYATIGIRVSGLMESGRVTCSVAWRFTSDDEFLGSTPSASIGFNQLFDDGGGTTAVRTASKGEEDPGRGDPTLPGPIFFPVPTASVTDVYGLSAKVVCSSSRLPGNDPDPLHYATGLLEDVKVLLRRDARGAR
ncbi:MAG: hypothetical protein GY716_13525 [bacterium]|nr:hypothetical protein [bacterium]